MYKLLKNTVRWSWPAGLGRQPTGRTQVHTAIFKTTHFGHIWRRLRGELEFFGFLTKKSRFSTLNSAKVPGIDRKCFLEALGTCAMRCRAFARSLVVKNLKNSRKIKNLRADSLLCLSWVMVDRRLILEIFHDFCEIFAVFCH